MFNASPHMADEVMEEDDRHSPESAVKALNFSKFGGAQRADVLPDSISDGIEHGPQKALATPAELVLDQDAASLG